MSRFMYILQYNIQLNTNISSKKQPKTLDKNMIKIFMYYFLKTIDMTVQEK